MKLKNKKSFVMMLAIMILLILSLNIFSKNHFLALGEQQYNAKSALLMDYNTGKVLYSQNINERRPIASMVKIMTLILIYEEIEKGNLSLEDNIVVSENAASMGGSQAFLDANTEYNVGELITSIVVASANDSCVALAEHISGSVDNFVIRMNEKANQLGLNDTKFVNCTGLPAPNQYSTAADVAVMFKELIKHDLFFRDSKIWMYDFKHPCGRVTQLTNTNKLVRFYNGCDGGKTGFTTEALSCLAATAKRGDTRLISVIIAAPNAKTRNAEVSKMLNYGFANFETRQILFGRIKLEQQAKVDNGRQEYVDVAPECDYFYLTKKGEKLDYTTKVELNSINAPVQKGQCVGKISIYINEEKIAEVNAIALTDVKKAGYLDIVEKLVSKW